MSCARGRPATSGHPQVALAGMLSKPYVTAPIVGASKLPHLEQAVDAASIRLTDGQLKTLEEPYRPHPVLGHQAGWSVAPVIARRVSRRPG